MNASSRFIAVAVLTAAVAPVATAGAAPLSSPLGLENMASSPVENVQYRRGWRRGGFAGPAIAGAIIGGAIIGATRPYGYGAYDDYGYAPGYAYAPGYRRGYVGRSSLLTTKWPIASSASGPTIRPQALISDTTACAIRVHDAEL